MTSSVTHESRAIGMVYPRQRMNQRWMYVLIHHQKLVPVQQLAFELKTNAKESCNPSGWLRYLQFTQSFRTRVVRRNGEMQCSATYVCRKPSPHSQNSPVPCLFGITTSEPRLKALPAFGLHDVNTTVSIRRDDTVLCSHGVRRMVNELKELRTHCQVFVLDAPKPRV